MLRVVGSHWTVYIFILNLFWVLNLFGSLVKPVEPFAEWCSDMHKMKSRGCQRNQLYGNIKNKVSCKGHTCSDLHFQRIAPTAVRGIDCRDQGWTHQDQIEARLFSFIS